jgi:hypothetical protein
VNIRSLDDLRSFDGDNLSMQTLRSALLLARFVLVWFALSVGVAIASPLVKPQSVQLVCSASGAVKIIADGGDEDTGALRNTLDCPLCAAVGAPSPQTFVPLLTPATGLGYALPQPVDAPQIRLAAAPFPPRGPPASV